MNDLITEEVMPALEGAIPSIMATASADGMPNATYIWQVFYVDEKHVAISNQFLNKTSRNIACNPYACLLVTSPVTQLQYKLHVKYTGSQQSGAVFDKMAMQAEIIAGGHNRGKFELHSADIYEILKVECIDLK